MDSKQFSFKFPHPDLTKVHGKPTFDSMMVLQRELNANARSIYSLRGNGKQGHLVLTCPPAQFTAMANHMPFITPTHPGENPLINVDEDADAAERRALVAVYNSNLYAFEIYTHADNALKQQLLSAVQEVFLATLRDRHFGFSELSTLQLLTSLWSKFGTVSHSDIERNHSSLNTPFWQPTEPIDTLFAFINDRVDFASTANAPISDVMVVQAAYKNIEATGVFSAYLMTWRAKPDCDKTWANFQAFLETADRDRLAATAAEHGFHANAARQNKSELQELKEELIALKALIASKENVPPNKRQRHTSTPTKPRFYCHTHGITHSSKHTSSTCQTKGAGHMDAATLDNQMGGSTFEWKPRNRE